MIYFWKSFLLLYAYKIFIQLFKKKKKEIEYILNIREIRILPS